MKSIRLVCAAIVMSWMLACSGRGCSPSPSPDAAAPESSAPYSRAQVVNRTTTPTTAYVSFGSDSVVTAASWSFCGDAGGCSFQLAPDAGQDLPTAGQYLNATISFDQSPACQTTLGEVNINNPAWVQDTTNISLVNGWSNNVEIDVGDGMSDVGMTVLGPTQGPVNNATVFGVYPNGCDICVAKQSPPCGITPCGTPDGSPSSCGCKAGTQYNPTVPCQASFNRGATVVVALQSH